MHRDIQRGRLKRLLPAAFLVVGLACGGAGRPEKPPEPSEAPVPLETPVSLLPSAPAPAPRDSARTVSAPSAPPVTPWYHQLGGPQDDLGTSVASDGQGHVAWVWLSTLREDADREPVDGQTRAVSIGRYSVGGEHRWTREFPRNHVEEPRVGTSRDGAVVLTGNASLYPIDFGLGAADDGFLVRFSAEGQAQWQRRVGQKVHGLAVSAEGDVLVSGEEWTASAHEPLLARYAADGTPRWAKRFTYPTEGTELAAVAFTPSGQALLAGALGGALWVDGRTFGEAGKKSLVLLAFGADGKLAWGQEARGVDARVTGLSVGADGTIAAVGESQGSVTWGDAMLAGAGPFVLTAGADGSPRWLRRPACGGLTAAPAVTMEDAGAAVGCGNTLTRYAPDGGTREQRTLQAGSCVSGTCALASTALASVPGQGLVVAGFQRDGAGWDQDAFLQLIAP